jgi:hypothetical protein
MVTGALVISSFKGDDDNNDDDDGDEGFVMVFKLTEVLS